MNISRLLPLGLLFFLLVGGGAAPAAERIKTKPCPQCQAAGTTPCPAVGCKVGKIECPGTCMRPSRGVWEKLDVKGHHPDELWQKFMTADGTGWAAWTTAHYGEVIEMKEGKPTHMGKCKVCGGRMQIGCAACKGSGKTQCSFCRGLKIVPESASWTPPAPPTPPVPPPAPKPVVSSPPAPSAPKVNSPAVPAPPTKPQSRFELKDGRVVIGYKSMVVGNFVNIRTDKGNVELDSRDIVKEEALPVIK